MIFLKFLVLIVSQIYFTVYCQDEPVKKQFLTCDFDLIEGRTEEAAEIIINSLPDICKEAMLDIELFEKMKNESLLFKDFITKLQRKEDPNYVEVEGEIPTKDWDGRFEIYEAQSELEEECRTHENHEDYIYCLGERRSLMIDSVDID